MDRVVAGNLWIQSALNWWMQIWFVTFLPKYVDDCSILSMDVLPLFTLWFLSCILRIHKIWTHAYFLPRPTFSGRGTQPLLLTGSRAASVKYS